MSKCSDISVKYVPLKGSKGTPNRGFQAGWLKNWNGTSGKRWFTTTCGTGCWAGPG